MKELSTKLLTEPTFQSTFRSLFTETPSSKTGNLLAFRGHLLV